MSEDPMFPVVIRMPRSLHDRIERFAAEQSRSVSAMARLILADGLANWEHADAVRREGIADGKHWRPWPNPLKPKRAYRSEMTMAEAIAADNAMDKRKAPKRRAKR